MPQLQITKDTMIPAGLAVSVFAAAVRLWSFVDAEVLARHMLERRVAAVEARTIPISPGNRWTCFDQLYFVSQMRILNPKIVFPEFPKVCEP